MRLGLALIALLLLAIPQALHAQPIEGLYIGAAGGGNLTQSARTERAAALGSPSGLKGIFAPGGIGAASIGYGLGDGWRFEVQGDYRNNGIRQLTGTTGPFVASGQQIGSGAMLNALFDLDIGVRWLFPYLGAGIGYQWTTWHGTSLTSPGGAEALSAGGTHGQAAYQGIAGLGFPIPHVPGLSATVEYRFMGLLGPQDFSGADPATGIARIHDGVKLRDDYNQSVLVGVRYAFDVAPPPVPTPAAAVAPAPLPARSYLVFFDWDKATLSDRARQIVADAAGTIAKVQHTRIGVNGYTDTSGTPKYNQALSVRRAQAVAAELVRLGVAKTDIAIQGFGETHLLVPTAAGVREPQNRRVEIVIQ